MSSSNLEVFLTKAIVFSTKNKFSHLLSPSVSVSDLKTAKLTKSSSSKKGSISSVKIVQSIKGKSSL